MEKIGIGVDIEEISRFEGLSLKRDKIFLERVFSKEELNYSYKKKKYYQHLAVRYCAKEAVVKALGDFNENVVGYKYIEIINNKNGAPQARIKKAGFSKYEIKLSMSHDINKAVAFVVIRRIE